MKKVVSFLTLAIVLVAFPLNLSGQAQDLQGTMTDDFNAVQFYEGVMSQPDWYNTESRITRGEMLQLPEDVMENMSTAVLLDAVLDYPFFSDVYAFNDLQVGVDILYQSFNGIRELSEREDLVQVILEKYADEPVLTENSLEGDTDVLRLSNLEILVSQDFVIEKMDEEDIGLLSRLSEEKNNLKSSSDVYGALTENVFLK